VQRVATGIESRDHRVAAPVAVDVHNVAAVAIPQQVGVIAGVLGPRTRPGAHADCGAPLRGAL
jgi:hypothetical protein